MEVSLILAWLSNPPLVGKAFFRTTRNGAHDTLRRESGVVSNRASTGRSRYRWSRAHHGRTAGGAVTERTRCGGWPLIPRAASPHDIGEACWANPRQTTRRKWGYIILNRIGIHWWKAHWRAETTCSLSNLTLETSIAQDPKRGSVDFDGAACVVAGWACSEKKGERPPQ